MCPRRQGGPCCQGQQVAATISGTPQLELRGSASILWVPGQKTRDMLSLAQKLVSPLLGRAKAGEGTL